jgi:hypothetical protein
MEMLEIHSVTPLLTLLHQLDINALSLVLHLFCHAGHVISAFLRGSSNT